MEPQIVVRREFLKLAVASLGVAALSATKLGMVFAQTPEDDTPFQMVSDPENPTELEREHIISIRLPVIAEDGSNVPIVVSMENHPMEPDHYIKSLHIFNFNDPIINKGFFEYSPANGMAHISTQIRMDGGDANVWVVSECSQHGKWVQNGTLKVSLGGC